MENKLTFAPCEQILRFQARDGEKWKTTIWVAVLDWTCDPKIQVWWVVIIIIIIIIIMVEMDPAFGLWYCFRSNKEKYTPEKYILFTYTTILILIYTSHRLKCHNSQFIVYTIRIFFTPMLIFHYNGMNFFHKLIMWFLISLNLTIISSHYF